MADQKHMGSPLSHDDRRRARRTCHNRPVEVFPCVGNGYGEAISATLRDLSSSGIGLVAAQRMPRGAQFVVRMSPESGRSVQMLCKVAWCYGHGGAWEIGAEFIRALDPSALPPADPAIRRIRAAVLS